MGYLKKKKQAVVRWPVTVLQDDREKKPLKLDPAHFKVKVKRLSVGDYTLEGWEDIIAIERKSSIKELVTNLSSRYRPTFKKFLAKLEKVPFKIIIIEDDLSNVIKTMLRMKTGLTTYSVYYWLSRMLVYHGISIMFVGKGRIRDAMVDELFVQIVTAALSGDIKKC